MSADSEYHYIVTCVDDTVHVNIDMVNWWDVPEKLPQHETIFNGSLEAAIEEFGAKFAA